MKALCCCREDLAGQACLRGLQRFYSCYGRHRAAVGSPRALPVVALLPAGGIMCDSLDCGVYFERRKVWFELRAAEALAEAGQAILGP